MDLISKEIRVNNYIKILSGIPLIKEMILPSEWTEKNVRLTTDVSPVSGPYRYDITPYWRPVIDKLSPSNPMRIIFIMKSGQSGATQGVVAPGCGWIIDQCPGNTMVTSGNGELSDRFVSTRLDPLIKSAGIQGKIRPNVIRARNAKSGDTDSHKQFAGGNMFFASINSIDTVGKQISLVYGFIDDYDARKKNKDQGNIFDILQTRYRTSKYKSKQFFISTPEMDPSPISEGYERGDKQEWFMPCPCCGEKINFIWNDEINGESVGVCWDMVNGELDVKSVRYVCQKCKKPFKEKDKFKMMTLGELIPTCKPSEPGIESVKINALYGAPNMDDWISIVRQWLSIFESGQEDESKMQVFKNLILAEPFSPKSNNVEPSLLVSNIRDYEIGIVPDITCVGDGAGKIVFITCAVDLNGLRDDCRIDYEVVAWTESGQSYSIMEGEIGSHYSDSASLNDPNRLKLTYRVGQENSAWDILRDEVICKIWKSESGENYIIRMAAIDMGYCKDDVIDFYNSNPGLCIMIKGAAEKEKTYNPYANKKKYALSASIKDLYLIQPDFYKDLHFFYVSSTWGQAGYMHFPAQDGRKYSLNNFFDQLVGEEKVEKRKSDGKLIGYVYQKKKGKQNHKLDCRCYNIALRDIITSALIELYSGSKNGDWTDLVKLIKANEQSQNNE